MTTADLKPQRRAAEKTQPSLPERPPAGPRPPRHGSAGEAWGPASGRMPCVAGTAEASLLGIWRLTRVQGDGGATRPTPRLWGRNKGQSCLSNPSDPGPGRGHGIAVCRTYCRFPGGLGVYGTFVKATGAFLLVDWRLGRSGAPQTRFRSDTQIHGVRGKTGASLTAQLVKNPPAIQETPVPFLSWEDPLEKGWATHSSILSLPWWLSW